MKAFIFIALTFATCIASQAADKTAPLTPRARANAARAMGGEETESLDRSFPSGSPRANQNAVLHRMVRPAASTNAVAKAPGATEPKPRDLKPAKTKPAPPARDK